MSRPLAGGGLKLSSGVQCAAFYCDPLAYPRKRPRPQGLPPLITPPGHEPDGFDFVTDKNKQVTHDR
ncbi:hypothetical protein EXW72_18430 [Pseudomonas sp. BCA14]|nr:hypothetical protein EXW70_19560 [Pseudomonas sp. JMN1]TFF08306.1 hypothetical protein EXW71_20160 [Pseudomonas sp. BCA17]TFF23780.1 hypothetical protein EXW72_18430 [Pseudomonas sp. BCA14]TFF28030.1 hypothetical protein EXW73_11430 [Pseudomonas sp. BCA13]